MTSGLATFWFEIILPAEITLRRTENALAVKMRNEHGTFTNMVRRANRAVMHHACPPGEASAGPLAQWLEQRTHNP
ncbi:MAG TPA: hypothetical protein VK789_11385, partial [Bryobacteraceae bacterium]|nr:hypothetical protein [Bryobacteraceae bacterium]